MQHVAAGGRGFGAPDRRSETVGKPVAASDHGQANPIADQAIDFMGEIDGSGADFLKMPAGGSRRPASHETVDQHLHFVHQEGGQVFKYASRKTFACSAERPGVEMIGREPNRPLLR